MGGGGAASPDRPPEVLAAVPASVETALAIGSGCAAATAMAPFILTIDRAVTEFAAGRSGMFTALRNATSDILMRPGQVLRSPALWMVIGVYGSTYAAANVIDEVCERAGASKQQHTVVKLAGVTAVNMSAGMAKDAAFAKMFGKDSAVAAGKKASEVARRTPLSMYGLFAFRDVLTIGAGFVVPQLVTEMLVQSTGMDSGKAAQTSQLGSPMFMQCICTPVHLLALDMFNAPKATAMERVSNVWRSCPQSTLTRMFRFLCAYGIGGIMNANLTTWHRRWSMERYCDDLVKAGPSQQERKSSGSPFLTSHFVQLWMDALDPLHHGLTEADLDIFFAKADVNHDGKLSEEEIIRVLNDSFGDIPAKRKAAHEMVLAADRTHDGMVSLRELKKLLNGS